MSFKIADYGQSKWVLAHRIASLVIAIALAVLTIHLANGRPKAGIGAIIYLLPVVLIWWPELYPRKFEPRWGERDHHDLFTRILAWLILLLLGAITFIRHGLFDLL